MELPSWCGGIGVASDSNFVYDTEACDEVARSIYEEISSAIERGLSRLGMTPVFEDANGVVAVRVVDKKNLGTAYLELRGRVMLMRLVLFEDRLEEELPLSAPSRALRRPRRS